MLLPINGDLKVGLTRLNNIGGACLGRMASGLGGNTGTVLFWPISSDFPSNTELKCPLRRV